MNRQARPDIHVQIWPTGKASLDHAGESRVTDISGDLHPESRASMRVRISGRFRPGQEGHPDEEIEVFGGADRLRAQTGGERHAGDRGVQEDGRHRDTRKFLSREFIIVVRGGKIGDPHRPRYFYCRMCDEADLRSAPMAIHAYGHIWDPDDLILIRNR